MQESSPLRKSPLLPIFRSRSLVLLLAHLFFRAEDGPAESVSAMAERLGLAQSTVSRDVHELETTGLVRSERVGKARVITVNRDSIYFDSLADLLLKAYGPPHILAEALEHISGIDQAYIYGSWAARFNGDRGNDPNDIDLLVIGDQVDVDAVYEAAEHVSAQLGRDVNPTIASTEEWQDKTSGFYRSISARPMVEIIGSAG